MQHDIVSGEEWLAARRRCWPRRRSWPSCARASSSGAARCPGRRSTRPMPSTRRPAGRRSASCSSGRGRLIVYHFMFAPDWQDGCPGCSQLGNHLDGLDEQLARHDATFAAVSRAPIDRIEDYRRRKRLALPLGVVAAVRLQLRLTRRRLPARAGRPARWSTASSAPRSIARTCRAPACSPAMRRARCSTPTRPTPTAATCRSACTYLSLLG